jgi:hypothetical protein
MAFRLLPGFILSPELCHHFLISGSIQCALILSNTRIHLILRDSAVLQFESVFIEEGLAGIILLYYGAFIKTEPGST